MDVTTERQNVEPILISNLVSFTLFGIGLLQFFHCYRLWCDGSRERFISILLLVLFLTDMGDTLGKGLYLTDFIRNLLTEGLAGALKQPPSVFSLCLTDGLIASLSHFVYVRRIYRLYDHNNIALYLIVGCSLLVSFAQLGASIATGIMALQPVSTWFPKLIPSAVVWLGGAAFVDVLVASALIFYLWQQKTPFARTNDLIGKWIILTLETGFLPAVLQVMDLILFLSLKEKPYHIAIAIVMPKLYINCTLIVLRTALAKRSWTYKHQTGSYSEEVTRRRNVNMATSFGRSQQLPGAVMVSTTVDTGVELIEQGRPRTPVSNRSDVESQPPFSNTTKRDPAFGATEDGTTHLTSAAGHPYSECWN